MAAATDRRNLRLFTYGGTQLQVTCLPGPVVSLAGFKDTLFAVVHMGMPLPGNQLLGAAIFNVRGSGQAPNFQTLPLAPKSTLSWLGFTDEGVVSAKHLLINK